MADISKITLPSGTTYNLKDEYARDQIADLNKYTKFLGVTTTALTDGATTNPITISGSSVTAESGDIATYGSAEFIFNGTSWQAFGDLSGLGALAFKDSASGNFTPAGTVSKPSFTGSSMTSTGKFTPAGTVSVSTNATTNKTATVSAAVSGTATYTPAGSVSQPTFSGTNKSVSVSGTPNGHLTLAKDSVSGDSLDGEISLVVGDMIEVTPNITLNTTTVNSITAVGTLPTCTLPVFSTSVSNETLTLGWTAGSFSQGTLPTKGSNTTVATSVKTQTASISNVQQALIDFVGESSSMSGSYTPEGTVSKPTFSGTGARLVTGSIAVPNTYTASFTGTEGNVSVSGTTTGSVSQPTFSGTQGTVSVS